MSAHRGIFEEKNHGHNLATALVGLYLQSRPVWGSHSKQSIRVSQAVQEPRSIASSLMGVQRGVDYIFLTSRILVSWVPVVYRTTFEFRS